MHYVIFGFTQTFPNKQVEDNVGGEALGLRVPTPHPHPESVPCPENQEPRDPPGREQSSGMGVARGGWGMQRRGRDMIRTQASHKDEGKKRRTGKYGPTLQF